MTPQEFLAAIGPGARLSNIDTGIPASFTLAQAALESGWGESDLAVQSKNLFGIKCSPGWTGKCQEWPTKEYSPERGWYEIRAQFRSYPSWAASLDDHARFFFVNPRYRPALSVRTDPNAFARQVQACGYATAPNYADLIIEIMQDNNLYQFDVPQTEWKLLPWAKV